MVTEAIKIISKGSIIVFLGVLFGRGIEYIIRIIIGRFLGPSEFGIFNIGWSIVGIGVSLSLFGLTQGVARFIPYYKQKKEIGKVRGTILCSLKVVFFLSLFISLVVFFLSDWISQNVFHEENLGSFLKIFIWSLPFISLVQLNSAYLRGFKAAKYKVYSEDLFRSLLLLMLIVLFFNLKLKGVSLAYILGFGAASFLGFYYLRQVSPLFYSKVKGESVSKSLLSYSWPLLFSHIFSRFQTQIPILFLGYFTISSEVGLYGASSVVARILGFVLFGLNFLLLPIFSELYASKNYLELKKIYLIVTKWLFYIVFPVSLLFIVFSGPVLRFFFGLPYLEAEAALRWLVFGFALSSFIGPVGLITLALGRTKIYLLYDLIGFLTIVGLAFFLIPKIGISGAALATSISIILWNLTGLVFVYKFLKVQPFGLDHLKYFFFSLGMFFVVYFLAKALVRGWEGLLIVILSYTLFSLFLIKVFMQKDKEGKVLILALKNKFKSNIF